MVISCNMALKFTLFLMISTFFKLPSAVAMPQISVNIGGNEVHGNIHNLISVNGNTGSNIESDKTLENTAIPSEDKTFEITAIPSEDRTFGITAIPSEEKKSEITAIPSEDKTFEITAIPSEDAMENVIQQILTELEQMKGTQKLLLSNVNTSDTEIKTELNHVEGKIETLQEDVILELNQIEKKADHQEVLLSNVNQSDSEIKTELDQMKGTQELLLNNVNTSYSEIKIELNHVEGKIETLQEDVILELNHVEEKVDQIIKLQECPGDMFLFGPSNGGQCFKYYGDSVRTWAAADQKCREEHLVLAEPKEPTSLRAYIVANYNPSTYTHLGGRGDDTSIRWVRSGAEISNSSPLWWPGRPGSSVTTADNLALMTKQDNLDSYPTKPYYAISGRNAYYTLCELVMN